MATLPRYPIYVPSKGRCDSGYTARFLLRDKVPFKLVVEPQEWDTYAAKFGEGQLLALPWNDRGLVAARNWIREHATAAGHKRHWQVDDNCKRVVRMYRGARVTCAAGPAFAAIEDFSDRYTNVALSGMNYMMFGVPQNPAFFLNVHVYSCTLMLNALPFVFRGTYNEDVDICLQVLTAGWCTISCNVFLIEKMRTLTVKGGQTDALYQGDGRLKMARALERAWPGVVSVDRRFMRPQHVVAGHWRKFDTPLVRDPAVVVPDGPNEYGLATQQVAPEIRSRAVLALHEKFRRGG